MFKELVQAGGKEPFSGLCPKLSDNVFVSVCVFQVEARREVEGELRCGRVGHKGRSKEHRHEFIGDIYVRR